MQCMVCSKFWAIVRLHKFTFRYKGFPKIKSENNISVQGKISQVFWFWKKLILGVHFFFLMWHIIAARCGLSKKTVQGKIHLFNEWRSTLRLDFFAQSHCGLSFYMIILVVKVFPPNHLYSSDSVFKIL